MIADAALGTAQGPINICSGVPITVRELAERIADEYGRRDLLRFCAERLVATEQDREHLGRVHRRRDVRHREPCARGRRHVGRHPLQSRRAAGVQPEPLTRVAVDRGADAQPAAAGV